MHTCIYTRQSVLMCAFHAICWMVSGLTLMLLFQVDSEIYLSGGVLVHSWPSDHGSCSAEGERGQARLRQDSPGKAAGTVNQ